MKINHSKSENRIYLICSGKSNLKICSTKISIDIRELEATVEKEIVKVIEECSFEDVVNVDTERAREILDIEQRIDRLVNALSESSEVSAAYISKQIDRLHKERESLLSEKTPKQGGIKKIDFPKASFEDKKLIASQFIEKILLDGENAEIIWKI